MKNKIVDLKIRPRHTSCSQLAAVGVIASASVATWVMAGLAQSPNAFGTPSSTQATPAAAIDALPGSRAQGWREQGRSEVIARHGVVATSDPIAAEAGLEILRQGGNAIDAAVAAGAVLDVTSQNDTGIGGDLFALVWSARDKKLYRDLGTVAAGLSEDPDSREAFLPAGRVPDLYSIIRNPGLARALRILQREGRDGFYRGEIAEAIVRKVEANDGVMSLDDLATFESEWVEPVSTNYHGYDVFQLPPPGQGFAALEMLNILEVCVPNLGMDLATLGHTCMTPYGRLRATVSWR